MINLLVLSVAPIFAVVVAVFGFWSIKDTRNRESLKRETRQRHYDEYMKRKSEREKLRLPR